MVLAVVGPLNKINNKTFKIPDDVLFPPLGTSQQVGDGFGALA
jgi:hypothetical protein